jgi:hypothetical protein
LCLNIPEDEFEDHIKIDSFSSFKDRHKKHAFVKVRDKNIHSKLLSKETLRNNGLFLNIKESAQEEYKRKLFFGRLSDEITKDKIIQIIETIRPDTKELIEGDFPQVPPKNGGKSRIAFVLFKTHQTAKEVKESFKKLLIGSSKKLVRNINPTLRNLLEECSESRNISDLIRAVDYHKKEKNKFSSNSASIKINIQTSPIGETELAGFLIRQGDKLYEIKLDLHEDDYRNSSSTVQLFGQSRFQNIV